MKKRQRRVQAGKRILMCVLIAGMVLSNVVTAPVSYAVERDLVADAGAQQSETSGDAGKPKDSAEVAQGAEGKAPEGEIPPLPGDEKDDEKKEENDNGMEEGLSVPEGNMPEEQAEESSEQDLIPEMEGKEHSETEKEQNPMEEAAKETASPADEESERLLEEKTQEETLDKIKEMIEVFPDEPTLWWMDKEELSRIYEKYMEIEALYNSLGEELQKQVDNKKLEDAGEFFASYVDPLSLSNTGDINSIPSTYSGGILFQGKRSTAIYGSGWKDGRYATNYSKDSNIWIKYPNSGSFYINGEHMLVDVMVYYWLSEGEAFVADAFGQDVVSIASPAWCGYGPQDFTVEMEYHFYKAGTSQELSVDGYLFAHDLDIGEGICGKSGAKGYYTSNNTTMTWKGSYVTGTVDAARTDYSMSTGVAFHSQQGAPFRLSYHGCEYYSIELSSVGVDGNLIKNYGNLNVTKKITNPSEYSTSPNGFSMNLKGTSAYGDIINQTVKTNAAGVATFSNIPMGTYIVTEQGAASYWDVSAAGKINIDSGKTNNYTITNIYKTGNIAVVKTIEEATEDTYNVEAEKAHHYNSTLSGFAYKLSGTSDSGVALVKYGVTDVAGKLTFSNIPVGTYDLQEIKASQVPADAPCKAEATQELQQYVIPETQRVTVTYDTTQHKGNTVSVAFHNALKKWSFSGTGMPGDSLVKVDADAMGLHIAQGDATLAGAVYGLYDGDKLIATTTTDETGHFDFDGTYIVGDLWHVQEITAAEGYLLDPTVYTVKACAEELSAPVANIYQAEIENPSAAGNTLAEHVKKQSLTFYKVTGDDDALEALAGAKFSVYRVADLENGKYVDMSDAELTQAIIDNYRNPKTLDFNSMRQIRPAIVYADANSADVKAGRLVKSVDYGADGRFQVTDGYLVAELESDAKGVVVTPNMPYGRYIIVETTTPENKIAAKPLVLNVAADAVDGEVYGDGNGTPLEDLVIVVDRPITALIRIKKLDANSRKVVLKPGAGYIIHDTEGAWFDYHTAHMTSEEKKEYKDTFDDLVVQSSQGMLLGTKDNPYVTRKIVQAESSGNVYVDTPQALPVGTYTLEEVTAPTGYILQGKEGVIAKDPSFGGNHTYYETEKSGAWDKGAGSTVSITVSSQEAVFDKEANEFVITATQQNDPAIGKISVYAEGEQLVSVQKEGNSLSQVVKDIFDKVSRLLNGSEGVQAGKNEDYTFNYETRPIQGAQFEIRAAEDIYSQEGGINAAKLFSKGDLVVKLTTDEKGQSWTGQEDWAGTDIAKGLPLGRYTITQIKAGNGFSLSAENAVPREIEISYAGQEVPVIYKDTSYNNPRQKVIVEVEKIDADKNIPLAGAVFGLYAAADITDFAGKVVIKADTLVATAKTEADSSGGVQKAVFAPDLPLGQYYIKELQAPAGYTTTQKQLAIDASYNADQRETLIFSETVENVPVTLQVNLMDYYTEEELNGATLQLVDEEGNSFTTILTEHENNGIILGLEINKRYALKEIVSPSGYHYNLYSKDNYATKKPDALELNKEYVGGQASDTIMFTVQDEEKLQVISVFNKPIRSDVTIKRTGPVPTSVNQGTDENGNQTRIPVYETKGLPGAEYALIAKEDVLYPDGFTGTLFATGDTVLDRYEEVKNSTLKNYSVEILAGEMVDVSAFNGITPSPGATEEEIQSFYQQNKNNVQRSLPNGAAVKYVLKTDNEGKVRITGLPTGEYEIVEVKAPNGYYRDAVCTKQLSLKEPETGERPEAVIEEVSFVNAKQELDTTIQNNMSVTKYSVDGKSRVPAAGAAFTLYAAETVENILGATVYSEGEEIETAISGDDGVAEFETDLPVGSYIIKETAAPAGHYISGKEIRVDLDAHRYYDGLHYLQVHDYVENAVAEVSVQLVDDLTGNELAGAVLNISDANGNPVAAWTTKTEGGYIVKGLNPGVEYTITESVPRDGYLVNFSNAIISGNAAVLNQSGATLKFKIADVATGVDGNGNIDKDTIPEKVEILLKNPYVVGDVRVNKNGEMVESWTLLDKVLAYVKSLFSYGNKGLSGVRFEVRAAEDILHPDGASGVVFHKGDIVETDVRGNRNTASGITDNTGMLSFNGMYLGKYELLEIDTVEGYLLDAAPKAFSLAYVDGYTSPVSTVAGDITVSNVRQKVEVTVVKTDAETGDRLPGALLGLYAAEDIKNFAGKVIVSANTLLETGVSDKNGEVKFLSDLPLGKYYVSEISAPTGYLKNSEKYSCEFSYVKDAGEVVRVEIGIKNQPNDVQLEVKKSAITDVKPGQTYRYTIEKVGNAGNCTVNDFVLTDYLPAKVELLEIDTGAFDGVENYSVWYRTSANSEFRLWKDAVSAETSSKLVVSELGLAENEHITAFQYRFGDVKKGFKELEKSYYDVKVMEDVSDGEELVNVIELTGDKFETNYREEDRTVTIVHRERKHHGSGSGQTPVKIIRSPKTGDTKPIMRWIGVCMIWIGIFVMWIGISRKKKRREQDSEN